MQINKKQILYGVGFGLLVVGIYYLYVKSKKNNKQIEKDTNNEPTKNIVIGDSQTPFIANASKKVSLLGTKGSEENLWKGGMGLKWLKEAVNKYPVSKNVGGVVINIGTNGSFNQKDDIEGLVASVRRVFPNAKLFAVQGSWGWSPYNKNVTIQQVKSYYDRFAKLGVTIISPPIGAIEPHGNKPIYKEIGKNIDALL
jgi:hypothetical protein